MDRCTKDWTFWLALITLAIFASFPWIAACGGEEEEEEEEITTGLDVVEIDGRMWTIGDNGDDITHIEAVDYVNNIDPDGFDDWRLPTLNELASLHKSGEEKSVACDDLFFVNIRDPFMLSCMNVWASKTEILNGVDSAWSYNFVSEGAEFPVERDRGVNMRVLAVRP